LFSVDDVHPRNGGYYAIDSLRIEKAYRHWGGELDTGTTPWEAGLGFTVDIGKVKEYIDFVDKSIPREDICISAPSTLYVP